MRDIKIAQRYKPFSHLPGVKCLLPGSLWILQCYPTLVKIFNSSTQIGEISLPHQGPCTDFTVQQDLEKGTVTLWGKGPAGFFRYRLMGIEKAPYVSITSDAKGQIPIPEERLALGKDKAQDWDLVKRRLDLCEILPVWLRLAQLIPASVANVSISNSLLASCSDPTYTAFLNLFRAGFEGMLVPRAQDTDLQGFSYPPIPKDVDPFQILAHTVPLIRQLFCTADSQKISFLPHLFQQFHSGRYIYVPTFFGTVDLEWTSHHLRRATLRASQTQSIQLELPKSIKRFRLRSPSQEKGVWLAHGSSIDITQGYKYCLDRFEK